MTKTPEKQLIQSILLWAALGVFSISLLTHAFSTMLFFDRLRSIAHERLLHAAAVNIYIAGEFQRNVEAFLRQLGSRTRARDLLIEYNERRITLRSYRADTEKILSDGVSANDLLTGIVRFDLRGAPVAAVGEQIPEKFWPNQHEFGVEAVIKGPFQIGDQLRITVGLPILDKSGVQIGQDIGFFDLGELLRVLMAENKYGQYEWVTDVFLVAPIDDELRFFTSGLSGQFGLQDIHDHDEERYDSHAQGDDNRIQVVEPERLVGPAGDVGALLNLNDGLARIGRFEFAAMSLPNSGWRILARESVDDILSTIYADMARTTTFTVILAAIGSAGLFIMMRRFTGGLMRRMIGLRAHVESSEAKYRELIDGSIQGIIIHEDFRPLLVNKAWADIHGYSVDEVMGLDSVLPLVARGHRKPIQSFNKARLDGKELPGRSEYQAINKDRDLVWVENLTKKIEWAGKQAIQSTVIDITERKRQERRDASRREELEGLVARRTVELRQQNQDLERALEREREYNAVLDQFVSMASHEFRTPLTIIDSTARRIERKADSIEPKDVAQRTQKIRNAVQRMLILIESVLSSASMGAGKLKMDMQPFGLIALVQTVCQRQQEVSSIHKIEANLDALPERFVGDPNLLDQVFTNLLSNAVKYAPDSPEIEVAGATRGKSVSLSVSDRGVGIPAEEQTKLFDKFFRASTSTGIAGTGIGLNLVAQIVELHGGHVEVESKEGQGSTFTVLLPIRTMEDYSQTPTNPTAEEAAA